jgi:RHS repeat-associated protein
MLESHHPFGEIIHEYNAYWHQGKVPDYMFNSKEMDEESGMYYYSARYYAPPVFISRDPLFEKYPFMSPYAYCMNNPIKYVDPTGMETEDISANSTPQYPPTSNSKPIDPPKIEETKRDNLPTKEIRLIDTGQPSQQQGTSQKSLLEKIEDFFSSIMTGGIWGTADNGQGQETRKGDGTEQKTDISPLTATIPDPTQIFQNSETTTQPEPTTQQKGGNMLWETKSGSQWNRYYRPGDSLKTDKEIKEQGGKIIKVTPRN